MTTKYVALVGNPNVGKTAVFNALTGLNQHTGNYAGVTVERKYGRFACGSVAAEIIDLPGAYSLSARSPDEALVADILLHNRADEHAIDGMLIVVDASNIERNLFFVSQLMEMELPAVIALNMTDIARRRGIHIDVDALSRELGLPVVSTCAHRRKGLHDLREAVCKMARGEVPVARKRCVLPECQERAAEALAGVLATHEGALGRRVHRPEVMRVLIDQDGHAERRLTASLGIELPKAIEIHRVQARANGASLASQEAGARYRWVRGVMDAAVKRPEGRIRTRSERIDDILTHRLWGSLVFLVVMLFMFQAIYSWSAPLMDLIDGGVSAFGALVGGLLPEGMLQSLVVDGVIAGVGSVLVFLPQILLLSLFIALLEDFGYMARAAFIMDKTLGWCGLSGHSFIPMLTSFACAIPGVLATRTIHHRRDRLATILVAPLMSCSARLPVYVIMIAAFVPAKPLIGGVFNTQGLALFLMYALGVFVAVPMAWIFRRLIFRGNKPPFLLEMPSYKAPQLRSVGMKVYREGREFLVRAGTLICAVAIVVWALAYFPHAESITASFEAQRAAAQAKVKDPAELESEVARIDHAEAGAHLRNSILGRMGHVLEPAFLPLGWDWRIATSALASFPAREIIVANLGTLFNLGSDEDENSTSLIDTLRAAKWPDGRPLFTLPVALSIMVFFALCMQCAATLVTMRRETKQWRWPALVFAYMTALAYAGAFVTYQTASWLMG